MPEISEYFIDTNIFLYAFIQHQDSHKSQVAKALILNPKSVISTSIQVINEMCVNLIKKEKFEELKIQQLIDSFYKKFSIVELNQTILIKASELRIKLQFSFWDSLIIASALIAGAEIVYTEDMYHSLIVEDKLQIINPFI